MVLTLMKVTLVWKPCTYNYRCKNRITAMQITTTLCASVSPDLGQIGLKWEKSVTFREPKFTQT